MALICGGNSLRYGFSHEPNDALCIANHERALFFDARTMAIGEIVAHEFTAVVHAEGGESVAYFNGATRQFSFNASGIDSGTKSVATGRKLSTDGFLLH